MRRLQWILAAAIVLAGRGPGLALEPGQLEPGRMLALGDSITRAFDAALPADNLSLSWSSGSRGFFEQILGLPDVKSHNQRISANFGTRGRSNLVAARNGARMRNLYEQAQAAKGRDVTYVTVLMGGNDVCRDTIAELPSDEEFLTQAVYYLAWLMLNIPPGATVQVAAIPDIKRLYEIGKDKTALGIIDCEFLWSFSALGFPCGSMLSPDNTEADRNFVRSRNESYNLLLQWAVLLLAQRIPDRFISYTDSTFTYPFSASDVSNLDCYHPSAAGQRAIARETWNDGFFRSYQKGS